LAIEQGELLRPHVGSNFKINFSKTEAVGTPKITRLLASHKALIFMHHTAL
jgi:hypothetical protein